MRPILLVGLAALLAAAPAAAELFLIQQGQDSSPYAFLPELPRGFYNSAYAYTNTLGGEDHSFEYYIEFDLPPELLVPGTVVDEAYAWIYYGFDYTIFGDTTDEVGEVLCHEVLEPWSQETLTWNDRPAIGTWFDRVPDITEVGMQICDVSDVVQGWIDDPDTNHGIAITSEQPRVIGFYTWDDGVVGPNFKPSLVVETLPEPGTASGLAAGIAMLAALGRRARRRIHPSCRSTP
ncbi:MAG: DNRLRE domain-containing protein [Myxococcota bacterium]